MHTLLLPARSVNRYQIVHCPTVFAPVFLRRNNDQRIVMTVHDLVPALFPEYSTTLKMLYYRYFLRVLFERIDHFIVPSKSVQNDLSDHYSVPFDRISVVYEGVSANYFPKAGIKQDYILAVSTLEPRKNYKRIVEAYLHLKRKYEISEKLIIVGKAGWGSGDSFHIPNRFRRSIIVKGYIPENELINLYQNAKVFVYPSLHEGFGLPVAEAMACGCPVVTSNLSSLPEVAGNACLLVNPYSVNDIASAIHKVLNNDQFATHLADKGRKQAHQFTWSTCALETRKVYETILNK